MNGDSPPPPALYKLTVHHTTISSSFLTPWRSGAYNYEDKENKKAKVNTPRLAGLKGLETHVRMHLECVVRQGLESPAGNFSGSLAVSFVEEKLEFTLLSIAID